LGLIVFDNLRELHAPALKKILGGVCFDLCAPKARQFATQIFYDIVWYLSNPFNPMAKVSICIDLIQQAMTVPCGA